MTQSAGTGSLPFTCQFPTVGDYRVEAVVTGTGGFLASSAQTVQVRKPAPIVVGLYYDVILSYGSGQVDVAFGTLTTDKAARYVWNFDDGSAAETISASVSHSYCCHSVERLVRVTILDPDGDVFATGRVIGRW